MKVVVMFSVAQPQETSVLTLGMFYPKSVNLSATQHFIVPAFSHATALSALIWLHSAVMGAVH